MDIPASVSNVASTVTLRTAKVHAMYFKVHTQGLYA